MPFRKSRQLSPRERVADEVWLCLAATVGCLLGGTAGWLLNRFGSLTTPLPALFVVAAFYGVMGLARWWTWWRMNPDDTFEEQPGH